MASAKSTQAVAFIALLAGGVMIGFAGIFMRLSDVNPVASAFWRMALAAPLLWGWAHAVRQRDLAAGQRSEFTAVLVLAGVYFAGDMGLWHLSMHYTTIANAALLSNTAPVFVALWIWAVHRVRFARVFIVGMALALCGAALLVSPSATDGEQKLLGDGLAFASALFYAAYQLTIKEARSQYSTARLMAWSTTITGVALLPFAWAAPGPFWPAEPAGWLPLLALALVAQIGGQTVIAYAFAQLTAAMSSVSLLIQPLTAAVAAWIIFDESMGPWQMVGGGVLLWGIYLARRGN